MTATVMGPLYKLQDRERRRLASNYVGLHVIVGYHHNRDIERREELTGRLVASAQSLTGGQSSMLVIRTDEWGDVALSTATVFDVRVVDKAGTRRVL